MSAAKLKPPPTKFSEDPAMMAKKPIVQSNGNSRLLIVSNLVDQPQFAKDTPDTDGIKRIYDLTRRVGRNAAALKVVKLAVHQGVIDNLTFLELAKITDLGLEITDLGNDLAEKLAARDGGSKTVSRRAELAAARA